MGGTVCFTEINQRFPCSEMFEIGDGVFEATNCSDDQNGMNKFVFKINTEDPTFEEITKQSYNH